MYQYKWEILEQEFLCEKKKRKEKAYMIKETKVTLKYIHREGDPKKTYVFLHGTASDSTSFISSIQDLPDHANIYLLDIPGFGKSSIENFDVINNFQETLENLILESIHLFIKDIMKEQSQIKSVRIVGHSFGGFLSILYTNKYPEFIKSLILIAPAGIFPALGNYGGYWALFFKLGLPYTLFTLLNFLNILNLLIKTSEFIGFRTSSRVIHDISVYTQNNILGHRLVASYITLFWNGIFPMTYWNKPVLSILIKLHNEKKIKLLFGKYDSIVPYHQGEFLKKLNMNVELVNCTHELHAQQWNLKSNKIKNCCRKNKAIITTLQDLFPNPELYACTLDVKKSEQIVLKLYEDSLTKLTTYE